MLREDWGVEADVWSVTSWTELRRQALDTEDWNRLHPDDRPRVPYVTDRLRDRRGPVVAVSDWMRAVPDQIAPFVPAEWSSLGTDGFGMSDTRSALRRHFRVDAASIVLEVLEALARQHMIHAGLPGQAIERYGLDPESDA